MAWVTLVLAGLFEIGWAVGLKYTEGFTRLWPSVATVVSMIVSLALLGAALRTLPLGTAYAVWTSVGTVLTVAYSVAAGHESISWLKALFLACIVGCVVGLKRLDSHASRGRG